MYMESEIVLDRKTYITATDAARLTGYTNDYVGQLCRAGKVEGRVIGRTRYVCRESLQAYDAESKKVVRAGRHRLGATPKRSIVSEAVNARIAACVPGGKNDTTRLDIVEHAATIAFRSVVSSVGIALIIVVAVFVPSMSVRVASVFSESTSRTINSEMLTASGASLPEVVRAYIELGAWSTHRLISHIGNMFVGAFNNGTIAIRDLMNPQERSVVNQGMVVVPSTGSAEENAELESRIRNSFSDEVSVVIDDTGNTGTITPVFRSGKEDEYLFVMVPLGG